MAQDAPHDHQDTASSDERSFVQPMTMTFLGPAAENDDDNRGSRIGSPVGMDAGKGNDVVLNAIPGGDGSASGGKANSGTSEGKDLLTGVAAGDASGDGSASNKGKSPLAADDDGELKVHIIMERERRRRMKDMFNTLHELMPHVSDKVDKATLVGETINFIKALEETKAQLEKKKQEQALARQAAAGAGASSFSMLRTAHGMAALSDGWDPVPPQQPAAAPPPPAAAAGPVGFQTWSTPNVVLSVLNDEAIINVCAPRQRGMLTMVVSVLSKHGIDVISVQVGADDAQSFLTIYTRIQVNGAGGENPSAEDIYKLAVSEIMVWISN
ncbi:transcription factor bHLH95-like [Panicum miliaceum]|uniref:Transcription factor bHLH95-like n=1 Tax=Panicum miliaceum TaxID=4540 RepID=A0A3L6RV71_PANMI|nr:transcription factor bHLH95-like [Panicum miliaceum]